MPAVVGGDAAMEPGPHGREEGAAGVGDLHPRGAAMEPAPPAGEEDARLSQRVTECPAAMEPGPHGREEVCASSTNQRGRTEPQWSPALTAGKRTPGTSPPVASRWCRNGARPSRPGRGCRRPTWPAGRATRRNGARPSRPGRVRSLSPIAAQATQPQWSPALTAGKRSLVVGRHSASSTCRNGARPSRPGRVRQVHRERVRDAAAMEPGPHGREESATREPSTEKATPPQWSPALTAGKSRCRRRRGPRASDSRNGARPSRPGRACRDSATVSVAAVAAMEPGPHGREEVQDPQPGKRLRSWPQWSPALTAGKSPPRTHLVQGPQPGPQWSPALTAGKSHGLEVDDQGHLHAAAMEPGPHGREEWSPRR